LHIIRQYWLPEKHHQESEGEGGGQLQIVRHNRLSTGSLLVITWVLVAPAAATAQRPRAADDQQALLMQVMPTADAFSEKDGEPRVFRAYRADPSSGEQTLVGYVFLTSDAPPEEIGYSAPIVVLVGIDLEGTITGARVLRYRESIRRVWGDFLQRPGVQEQYAGKHIADPFRVGRDVDGITRATITMSAMSRGIRNAARRVAAAYLPADGAKSSAIPSAGDGSSVLERLDTVSWPELLTRGVVVTITISAENVAGFDLSFAYLGDEELGGLLVGADAYAGARAAAGGRVDDDHLLLIGLDGSFLNLFDPQALTVRQAAQTVRFSRNDFVFLGEPRDGIIAGQVQFIGALLVDRAVDVRQPFIIEYDMGPPLGLFSTEYAVPAEVLALERQRNAPVVTATPEPKTKDEDPARPPSAVAKPAPVEAQAEPEAAREEERPAPPVATPAAEREAAPVREDVFELAAPTIVEEDTALSRLFTGIVWSKVAPLLALFAVVLYAFLRKNTAARWLALAGTMFYLGFVDGGFLSMSHITAGITTGLSVYVSDLPLLLIVTFTVVTTLLWGRVLCGFLCPFGALQDFLERVVPRRLQHNIPQRIHDRAIYIKYAILGLIVVLAVVASEVSIFQYFEPFGTVFFLSPSIVLWSIAIAILVASALVPRFYCRYICPLGAALGLASLLAPFRIRRVDACNACKVCERSCPTGAIRGPDIDFKECVRCDTCEVKLLTRAGVCRKLSMDEILVQLRRPGTTRQPTGRIGMGIRNG
jgi:Na+-translocating ferredoxin:NAD+ oxidoreductase RnfG subunit/ferredoxin